MKWNYIILRVKVTRIKWLGHIWRAESKTQVRKLLEWEPGNRKRRGRARLRWLENVEEDLKRIGIARGKRKTSDRQEWKNELKNLKNASQ